MHIVLFFTYDISIRDWMKSGLFEREIKLYKHLNKKYGYRFTFITYDETNIDINEHNFIKVIPVYSIIKKENNKILRFVKSLTIPFRVKKLIPDFKIIKTNQLNGAWVAIIFKMITNKPLFIRTGYDIYTFAKKEGKKSSTVIFYWFLTKIGIKFSDIYSVTSNVDKSFLKKNFKSKDKIVLIPNWVDKIEKKKVQKRYQNRVISVGRLENQKNYKLIFNAMKNSKFNIDIVGEGSLREELMGLAKMNGVNVTFMGTLPHETLQDYYEKYKIFITSSKYEGNPKAILEAMASGCVVVAMRNENIEEIITHGVNGILFDNRISDLNELVEDLLNNEKELSKLSKNSIESVSNNNINKIIETENSIYFKLIK
tara:strand:+ start:172 stop:1281 length:1110 start_codon:yes stop_codon:yes gene_type:complete